MTIDKSTGKGCAQSILSKVVARRLVDEGIAGKSISRRPNKLKCGAYHLLRVVNYGKASLYVKLEGEYGPRKKPLWAPSFLDAETWEHAVSQFQNSGSLDYNVEKYLLPEMEDYVQSFSEEELLSITRDFLIGQGVLDRPVSRRGQKTYYFNENEVYSMNEKSNPSPYPRRFRFGLFETIGETCFNMNVWRKAVARFKIGATLEECIRVFLATELEHHSPENLSPIDGLVQYIAPPAYERAPENRDKSTFDWVRITVGLPRYRFDSWDALRDEVKKYQKEIFRRVLQRLKDDCQFEKYGLPIQLLKVSNVTLLHDFSLEFIFEPKVQDKPCDSDGL